MVSGLLIKQDALLLVGFSITLYGAFRTSMLVSCSLGGPLSYGLPVVVLLIVGFHTSGIFIPLSPLMLLE